MAHNMLIGSEVIKTHFKPDLSGLFFSSNQAPIRRRGGGKFLLKMHGCTDPQEWDDTGCNVQPAGLIQPEPCHTKGSECCVDREGGREGEPSGRKHDLLVCRKWPCW